MWQLSFFSLDCPTALVYSALMESEQCEPNRTGKKRVWLWLICLSCVLLYGSFSYLLSLAWFKGDDYLYATHDIFSMSHVHGAIHTYLNRVSRVGEIVAYFLGIMNTRWQHWVFSPVFLVLLPFVMLRLVCVRVQWRSVHTLLMFWFIVFLALQSVYTEGYWRNYWCFTACTNYFWATVVTFAFLPVMFPWKWSSTPVGGRRKWLGVAIAFALGGYSGWGTEAMTATLLPLLTCWMLYLWFKVKAIPMKCWAGYVGFCLGAFFLFASPALSRRAASGGADRSLDVASLSAEEISAFVQSLNAEKLAMLVDGCGCVNLSGIPLMEHLYFLPYLWEAYWPCCQYPTWMLVALVVLTLLLRPLHWKRHLVIAGGLYGVSLICAASYLGGAIPGSPSFLPPAFIVMAACVFLLANMKGCFAKPILVLATLFVAATGWQMIVPAAVEAHHYKKYEHDKFAEIERQKAQGKTHVVLYRTWPAPPKDPLGLICPMELGPDPAQYPNSSARHYYGVEGISLMPSVNSKEKL